MSVFAQLYRYRFPLLFLSFWLAIVLMVNNYSAYSQLITLSYPETTDKNIVIKNTHNLSMNGSVRKTILENGLTILTKEVRTAPVVTVQVWYKVGSRNEEPGVNGIAHQLEHMMFKGTTSRPIQFGRLFSALGSDSNAFTSYDQTAYYGTAESEKLKALLELEADRMQNSPIAAEQLASEKRVVISELQGYENDSEYRLNRAVMRAAFPYHPYGLPVGGTKADVNNFTVEQVRKYYHNFYSPDNAVLAIVGDFQTDDAIAFVTEKFGKIAKNNQELTNNKQQLIINNQELATKNPIILKEPGAAAILQAVYPLPDINHPDSPALDVMDYILSEGRNSRLYQVLVDSGIATDVSGSVASLMDFGWYELSVTASPKEDLKKIDGILTKEITKLAQKGVNADELKRAKVQFEAGVILGNRDITSQAMQLANDETVTGDHNYINRYLERLRKVTSQDVQRVAKQYLKSNVRTVGYFQPSRAATVSKANGKANLNHTHESFISSGTVDAVDISKYLPKVEKDSKRTSNSQNQPESIELANGLRILMLPDKSTPTVTLSGYIKAGSEFDPENKAGLAELVADNLLNGTKTKNVLSLAIALEERGANLEFNALREGVRIEGDTLATDLPILLHTLADAVQNPIFPSKELELSRKQSLNAIEQDLDEPAEVAKRAFVQSIYPKTHPSHNLTTEDSLRRISRRDVIEFKAKHYRPDRTILTMVGDFDPELVRSLINQEFGNWKNNGEAPSVDYPAVSIPDSIVRVNTVLPGKAQAIIYMGNTAINRQDGRYYAALVLNQILGGDTLSSRLGAEVRDKQGLTYGIYSNFLAGKNSGTFLIEMQTSPEDANRAIASTRKLLEEMNQKGVSEEEVEAAKRTAISNYIVSLANPDELTHQILMNEVYGLEHNELIDFTDKIDSITLTQVNQAARELLHPDKIVVVTAGPTVVVGQGTVK
ncbi:M16 family metallopeptidase [Brunnivagina elsteri]|uniref:Peptidase M16 n=1 Tax=Brunnivagina elsteri CCALA 953 TaxID=987040 RepID=A0A2A2TL43_9CYAN|nr:pitrilysin family protein [Calothrix elsteri]PAX58053.1 peptidase M16 [Calothrix elsteri CCALA 953]